MATDYLVTELGCKNVVVIAEPHSHVVEDRIRGHVQFMRRVHGSTYQAWVTYIDGRPQSGGYYAVRDLVEKHDLRPQAEEGKIGIFATDDSIAQGVQLFLNSNKDNVASKIRVIGFGGQDFVRFMDPPLPTIAEDYYDMGFNAVQVLLGLISSKREGAQSAMASDLVAKQHSSSLSRKMPVYFEWQWVSSPFAARARTLHLPSVQEREPGGLLCPPDVNWP